MQECGYIIRQAFPGLKRRRIHSVWYYYGLSFRNSNGTRHIMNNSSKTKEPLDNVESKRLSLQGEKRKIIAPNTPVQDRERPEMDEKNKLKNGLAYKVSSFNIDMRALSPLHECALIGEGTFGKCLSGKYQNLPVAVKVFKGNQSVKSIHHEANILLQVPSQPNIAMLLGVQTVQYPFLLLSRLCHSDGIPMTYSKYLHHIERTTAHLKICLHLMYEIAEGLNHIHCHSILHNDLKRNNIVVEGSKEVQHAILIDFGKAGMPHIKGNKRRFVGEKEIDEYRVKYPHIAPEVASKNYPTNESDIYSYGYLFCSTLKVFREVIGSLPEKNIILELETHSPKA